MKILFNKLVWLCECEILSVVNSLQDDGTWVVILEPGRMHCDRISCIRSYRLGFHPRLQDDNIIIVKI